MYIVEIQNGNTRKEIHGQFQKLTSGKVTQGINAIDSFVFTLLPNNAGFSLIRDFTTLVTVYNTRTLEYEFQGRVLYTSVEMSDDGMISKQVTCESMFGYLCDSVQDYVAEKNWTVRGLLEHIINAHNSLVEPEKRFAVRTVTVEDKNDNLYVGIQRENTWETIKKKLIEVLGGEITFEVSTDGIYLDYVPKIGEEKKTAIELSKNMKSITKECDPSDFITRLIPLGAKKENSEERVDIRSVNKGVEYIDDEDAIAEYGIHVGVVEWDDVTEPSNLYQKGEEWLEQNNKVLLRYSVAALDLFLIGLAFDSFKIGNTYPLTNGLLTIQDKGRIIKRNVDVCEEPKSTFEIGDNFKTASEMQRDQKSAIGKEVANFPSTYASKKDLDGFMTRGQVETLIKEAIYKLEIPTKTSDLENDSEFVTKDTVGDLIEEALGEGGGSGDSGSGEGGGSGTPDAIEKDCIYMSSEQFEQMDAAEGTTIACAVTSLYEEAEGALYSPLYIHTYYPIQYVQIFLDSTLSGTYEMYATDGDGNELDGEWSSNDLAWTFTPSGQFEYTDIYIQTEFVNDANGNTATVVPFDRVSVKA